jgi:serine protease Do
MNAIDELTSTAQAVASQLGGAVVTIGQDGRGTGVVIAPGKVLTNAHNLRDRTTSVTFSDGRAAQATLAGADGDGDLVVVDVDTASAPAATWAEVSPQPGDVVFAVSRGGHRQRISFGMVTTVDLAFHGPRGRTIEGGVEHTAALPRGSSGGPLVNAAGAVVGINTHRVGRGFYVARPVDAALQATIDGLAAGKSVTRPHLGVALAPPEVAAKLRASVGLPAREGLLVRAVEPDSPAAKAGLAEGDLLVAVNRVAVTSLATLYNVLTADTETIELTVVRGAEERTVVVTFTADEATTTDN